jgi:alpha-glucosidase
MIATPHPFRRSRFLVSAMLVALPCAVPAADSFTLASPDGKLGAKVSIRNQELFYQLDFAGKTVLEAARLGVTVDGVDLGSAVKDLKAGEMTEHQESYALNGDESLLKSHDKRVTLTAEREGEPLVIELRAFDRGLGFRYVIPGKAARKVSGEATSWGLPAETKIWFRTNTHGDYSDRAENAATGSLPVGKEVVGPLLAELPGGQGYVGITEADPWNYSGLSFKFSAADKIGAQFKYDAEWSVNGGSASAWRVAMVGADLNSVMQGRQLVTHLSPAPDPKLYPQGAKTPWIQPGRSAWSWLDPNARARGGVTVEHQKRFIDLAAELGFEYNTVDDGWELWPDKWKTLAELAAYAKSKKVKLIAWKDTADADRVPDPADNYAKLRTFLDQCRDAGLAGIKIDFLWGNPLIGEGSKTLGFMPVVYRMCAERKLLVNFHGAVKPTGQARSWPNAITQEPVLGMEAGAAPADAAVVAFLCGLSGYCDYTPGLFAPGESTELRGKSTWTHQMALGIVFCSPIQHWASGPELSAAALPAGSPERAIYQAIPPVWDETVVLEASKVGSVAAFARRKGKDWYLGIINGSADAAVELAALELPFLAGKRHACVWLADGDKPDAFRSGRSAATGAPMTVKLAPGGGFVAIFRPE